MDERCDDATQPNGRHGELGSRRSAFAKRIRKAVCGELPGSPERSANAGTVGSDEPAAVSQVSPWVEGAEEVRFVAQPFGILTLPSK